MDLRVLIPSEAQTNHALRVVNADPKIRRVACAGPGFARLSAGPGGGSDASGPEERRVAWDVNFLPRRGRVLRTRGAWTRKGPSI